MLLTLIFYIITNSFIISIILCFLYIQNLTESVHFNIFYHEYINNEYVETKNYIDINKISTIVKTDKTNICNICQEDIYEGLKLNCNCKYIYHADCLVDWLRRSLSCPLCRHEFII